MTQDWLLLPSCADHLNLKAGMGLAVVSVTAVDEYIPMNMHSMSTCDHNHFASTANTATPSF